MKRCKAVTSRACDSIECCLLADHEGAHEGQRDAQTRAVWTNPDAPEYVVDAVPLAGSREQYEVEREATIAAFAELQPVGLVKTPQTHCPCGTEHSQQLDPSLRTEFGFPLAAWSEEHQGPDQRFAWPRICRYCGIVYCQRWDCWKKL